MKAQEDKVVAVSYELEVEGKIADKAGSDKPLEYIHGSGMLIPMFEKNVEGKEPGETFDFVLTPENGYGVYHPEYKIEIPKSSFAGPDGNVREDLLTVGRMIPMLNSDGQVIQGTVAAIAADKVTMDFNHPMAGKTLHFTGKVESVRDATDKELVEGLHGEFLPKEDCGGCGCHGDGCEKGNCHEGEGCCDGKEGKECHGGKKGGCCHNK